MRLSGGLVRVITAQQNTSHKLIGYTGCGCCAVMTGCIVTSHDEIVTSIGDGKRTSTKAPSTKRQIIRRELFLVYKEDNPPLGTLYWCGTERVQYDEDNGEAIVPMELQNCIALNDIRCAIDFTCMWSITCLCVGIYM